MNERSYRLGIDAGGTFTDFILQSDDGKIDVFKTPSTPSEPSQAIRNGLEMIGKSLDLQVREFLSRCELIIHGTTVALNALVEHKGAKVGLFCTSGHEDSLEIRLGHKEDKHRYDFTYPPAKMLVPKRLRVPVRERIRSDGKVITPLHEEDILRGIELFKQEGVEAIAVSYVWSFLHSEHEERTEALIREHLPDVYISLSTKVFPQIREYTRVSTTTVNAYVGPVLKRYIESLESLFKELGYEKDILYTQNNGGVISGKNLINQAVYALNSGPSAGPLAGLYFSKVVGTENVLTIDMGGTSLDISLTKDGRTEIIKDSDFMRYRLGIPMVHVETLGAGGGSIASVDETGLFKVGPQSAGALPGPACYGKGGNEPTVTDSLVTLGYLNQEALLGGKMKIDSDSSRKAIQEKIAKQLNLSVERAALGIYQIVNNNMVAGIRRISIEKGHDPRDFILVAAGGAGGAHAARLAEELGIEKVVVPRIAGAFCAFGAVLADVKHTFVSTFTRDLSEDILDDLNKRFEKMEAEGIRQLLEEKFDQEDIYVLRTMDMRYRDQLHECTVPIPSGKLTLEELKKIANSFHQRHEELYTYSEPDNVVEIISLETTICGRVPSVKLDAMSEVDTVAVEDYEERNAYFEEYGEYRVVPVFRGGDIPVGQTIEGAAIVEEETTTILIPPKWKLTVLPQACFLLEKIQ